MPDFAALLELLNRGGTLAVLAFLIAAFLRGWIVPGYIHERLEKRLDRTLDAVEQVTPALDRLTDEIRDRRRVPNA